MDSHENMISRAYIAQKRQLFVGLVFTEQINSIVIAVLIVKIATTTTIINMLIAAESLCQGQMFAAIQIWPEKNFWILQWFFRFVSFLL